eukprot:10387974-Alexandrium_andersonii.AAC.1
MPRTTPPLRLQGPRLHEQDAPLALVRADRPEGAQEATAQHPRHPSRSLHLAVPGEQARLRRVRCEDRPHAPRMADLA